MTATVYECENEIDAIQSVLTTNVTLGDRIEIVPKGTNFVNIVIYNVS